jgi:hypothetical protein
MGTDGALDLDRFLPLVVPFHQGAHRANVDARAAKLTSRLQKRRTERRANQGRAAPLREADRVVTSQFLASPDAPATDDAQVVVPIVEGIGDFQWNLAVFVLKGRFQIHAQVSNSVLEFAPFVFGTGHAPIIDRHVAEANVIRSAYVYTVAGKTSVWMLGKEHLHHRPAQFPNVGGLAADFHPVGHRLDTSGGEASAPFHANHTHPAGRKGLHTGMVAEVRDIHSGLYRRLQNHLPRLGSYLYSIDGESYVIGHGYRSDGFWPQSYGDTENWKRFPR